MTTLFFIIRRLLQMFLVLLGTITVLFIVLYVLVPGDAAQVMLGAKATPESLASLRQELGLDKPLWVQYGIYLSNLAHFDLGTSYALNLKVKDVILDHLPATAVLAGAALFLEAAIGIGWGALMASRRSVRLDVASAVAGAVLIATPVFFFGLILQRIFGSWLGILPISGLGGWNPAHLILPALTLAVAQMVVIAAVMRTSLSEEMGKPYIIAARAKGLSRARALRVHGMRNALGPVATLLAIDLGILLGGALITEIIFAWPGLGRMMYFAARARDVPLVIGIVLVLVVIFVIVNTAVDIFYKFLDPRIKLGEASSE